jgi:GNAT superfamily N-acetyltransferase
MPYLAAAQESTAALSYGRASSPPEKECRLRRLDRALNDGEVKVARENDVIAGYYWLRRTGARGRLLDFFVEPPRRRSGVSDLLWGHLAAECLRVRVRVVEFAISDRNAPSLRFFSRHGAVPRGDATPEGLREYEILLRPPR